MRDTSDTTIVAPGVTRKDLSYAWKLMGTKEALIASGHAKPEWFPTWLETDRRGRVKRTNKLNIDRRRIEVCRPALGPCEVIVSRTDDERAEYIEAHREEREREHEQQRKANRARLMDEFHESETQCYADALSKPGGLKTEARKLFVTNLGIVGYVFGLDDDKRVYFRFPREVRERARELIVELNELFEGSEMTPTREVKARADVKFQSFIKTVLPST